MESLFSFISGKHITNPTIATVTARWPGTGMVRYDLRLADARSVDASGREDNRHALLHASNCQQGRFLSVETVISFQQGFLRAAAPRDPADGDGAGRTQPRGGVIRIRRVSKKMLSVVIINRYPLIRPCLTSTTAKLLMADPAASIPGLLGMHESAASVQLRRVRSGSQEGDMRGHLYVFEEM